MGDWKNWGALGEGGGTISSGGTVGFGGLGGTGNCRELLRGSLVVTGESLGLLGGAVVWGVCVSPGMSPQVSLELSTVPVSPWFTLCPPRVCPSGVPRDVRMSPTGAHVCLGMSPVVSLGVSLPPLCHRGRPTRCPCPPASPHGCSLCFVCVPCVTPGCLHILRVGSFPWTSPPLSLCPLLVLGRSHGCPCILMPCACVP